MKARIIHLAVLVLDTQPEGSIEDALNEILRPATQTPSDSLIVDYVFNSDGSPAQLPPPIGYELPDGYEEGTFLKAIP